MHSKILLSICSLLLISLIALSSDGPEWWSERGAVSSDVGSTNDYAVVNIGQLKNISLRAYDECVARGLPENNEHDVLIAVLYPWLNEQDPVDYDVVNVGQVKNLASLFYSWLISAGYESSISFSVSQNDYAVANVGQVKNVFSFDPSETDYNDAGIIGGFIGFPETNRVDGAYEDDIAYWKIFDAIPSQTYYGEVGDVVLECKIPSLRNGKQDYPEKTWWRQYRNKRSPEERYFLSSINDAFSGWNSQGLKVVEYGGLYSEVHQYSTTHTISDSTGCALNNVDNYAPEGIDSRIQLVYTGGGIIELDAPVYLLQWAPRVLLGEMASN